MVGLDYVGKESDSFIWKIQNEKSIDILEIILPATNENTNFKPAF